VISAPASFTPVEPSTAFATGFLVAGVSEDLNVAILCPKESM
jgi:hypothetical protein